ncbi:response regulator [Rhodopila sp.]|uniref:response regulator n=1 Tax=Rhodopila sp. TaxID=2480087 RepID=UPI003D0FFA09
MKILVAEDDFMLADFLEEALVEQGHDVCGVASNVRDAVELVRSRRPEVIVLDLQLGDNELGTDIVDQLMMLGDLGAIGVLYVSGDADRIRRDAPLGHACLNKPYSLDALEAALEIVLNIARGSTIAHVLPHGMELLPQGQVDAARLARRFPGRDHTVNGNAMDGSDVHLHNAAHPPASSWRRAVA